MRKHLLLLLVAVSTLLLLTACTTSTKSKTPPQYADDAFYTSLQKGLADRWKLNEKIGDDAATRTQWEGFITAELTQISKYQNQTFKSAKLQQLAITYINAVKAQKSALKYLTSTSTTAAEKWNKTYNARTQALKALNDYRTIKVSKQNQGNLDMLLGNAQSVNEDQKVETTLKKLASTLQFTESGEDAGWKTYPAVATNTTDYTIKSFQLTIKLIDAQGVTIDTAYASTADWTKGSKVQFEFETDKAFAKYEVTLDSYDTQS